MGLKNKNKMDIRIKQKIGVSGVWTVKLIDESTGKVTKVIRRENHIPDVGIFALVDQMTKKSSTFVGDNMFIVLGTDSTAPGDGNTQLGNEVLRKATSDETSISGMASFYVYIPASEAPGTYREIGLTGNGSNLTATTSANTGVLYSRVVQSIVVPVGQGMQLQYDFTIARA